MTLAIAVDPGSVRSGYAVLRIDRDRLSLVDAGTISAPAGWPKWRRLVEFESNFREVCREVTAGRAEDEPILCAVEGGFEGGNPGGRIYSEVRGIAIVTMAVAFDCEVREYAPTSVKKCVTGNGHAEKFQVAEFVRALLLLKRTPATDCADAIAVAVTRARDSR